MKKMILVGRSECGKTTLRQALKGETLHYHKTQYVNHYDVIIDTPGEYAETGTLGRALALYSYEADVTALLINSNEPYSLYPPCCAAVNCRPTIGIVTQIDGNVIGPKILENPQAYRRSGLFFQSCFLENCGGSSECSSACRCSV